MRGKANTEQNFRLEIRRVIKATRDRVYAAWTDPAQLKEWFGPENVRTRDIAADAREGGEFRWDLINQDGKAMTIGGEFRVLQPGRKIVFTWWWEDNEDWGTQVSVVTVELSDRDGGTELLLTHEKLPTQQLREGHHEGWNSALDKLGIFLTK